MDGEPALGITSAVMREKVLRRYPLTQSGTT